MQDVIFCKLIKISNMSSKKLTKSYNRMIAGVCGGIAEYFDVDATVIRVAYVLLSVCTAAFPGLLVYLLLCLIMPNEGQTI